MLDLSRSARDFLAELPAKQFKQVTARILDLLVNTSPHDCQHLSGYRGYMRIDQGEYRIIYYVQEGVVRVPIVGKRNDDEVYRKLSRKA